MTRGNQRDLARAKAAKKQEANKKSKGASEQAGNAGLSMEARKQRDADIMRAKQAGWPDLVLICILEWAVIF